MLQGLPSLHHAAICSEVPASSRRQLGVSGVPFASFPNTLAMHGPFVCCGLEWGREDFPRGWENGLCWPGTP